MLHLISLSILPILLIIAALSDVMTYRIPNWLTLTMAGLFFPMAFMTQMPFANFMWHLAAGALLLVIGFILFAFRIWGAGDAKLMAAAGLWLGMANIGGFVTQMAFAGLALIACMFIYAYLTFSADITNEGSKLSKLWQRLRPASPNVPYGFAIAAGGILVMPHTWWVQAVQ